MKEIIEHNDSGDNQIVNINDTPVSMKLVQSIYHEITGKTEKLSKTFRDSHEVSFEDLKNLNTKIEQLYEPLKMLGKNCSVTVYHIDDCKKTFSSFEKFSMYDDTSMSPCENIRLVYDLLILLPETEKVQPYKIEINIHSRIALRKKVQKARGLTRTIMHIFASRTGEVEISYVDYVVARNFKTSIDEWYDSVPKNKENRAIKLMQNVSVHFSLLFKVITVLVISLFCFDNTGKILGEIPSIETIFSSSIVVFSTIFISAMLAARLGSIMENAIDEYQPASCLKLVRGDNVAYKDFVKVNRKSIAMALAAIICTVVVNVISTYLCFLIGIGL